MKYKLLTIVVIFGMIMTANSQGNQFGLKGGLNLATLNGNVSDDFKSRTSFHFGIVSEFSVSNDFSIQPELLYSAQGAKDKSYDEALKIDYLNLPIMAKYYVSEGLSIEAGPQLGVLLSAKSEVDGADDEDIKEFLKGIDIGVNVGLAYKLGNSFNVGARYNIGLSNINDEDGVGDVNNGVLQFFVGYLIN